MSAPDTTEKLMSISRAEFLASLVHVGNALETADGAWTVPLDGGGNAIITFEAVPGVRLGGLLDLPRARVSIRFDGGSTAACRKFLLGFELAFQRGGG